MNSSGNTPQDTESLQVHTVQFEFQEIRNVVDKFYTKIQMDPDLKVPFESVNDWPHHIERLTHFWWTRFGGMPYLAASYDPVEKHFLAGFNDILLKKWLKLFRETLENVLGPDQSRFWAEMTERMGRSLSQRNDARILASQK